MRSAKASETFLAGEIWGFVKLFLKPLMQMIFVSLFKPKSTDRLSTLFYETYSRAWDFAEHSISHHSFSLPSARGAGPVHRTNKLLSDLYGAKFSSLSLGGSSGALLTILTAVLPKIQPARDLILFDSICHQSAIGGLIFGRWKAIRMIRATHAEHQTVFPLTLASVRSTLEHHGPDKFAAIILVLPSYDGYQSPSECEAICAYARSHGITVIVDGAWDSLRFRRPQSQVPALSSISDVWISSPHKRGLTPSSLGCVLTDSEVIARYWDEALELGFRSSSISFVEVMIAEYRLSQVVAGEWNEDLNRADEAARQLRKRIPEIHSNLYVVRPADVQAAYHDPSHILLSTNRIDGLDARDWAETLSNHFAFDVEKATASTLLLLCGSPAHLNQIDQILACLKKALQQTMSESHD